MNAFKFVDRLEGKGFTREQSEESVKVMTDMINENVSTKSDILEVRNELKDEMHKLDKEFSKLKIEVTKIEDKISKKMAWYFGATVSILSLLKFFS